MKTYNILVNTAKKFESANYLKVGTVKAKNKADAVKKANDERKGNFHEDVQFSMNMDNDFRPLKIGLK